MQQPGIEFTGGFGHQDHADVELGHLGRCGPFEKGDQIHSLLDAGIGFLCCGNQFFGEIDDQRDAFPFLLLLGHAKKEAAEQGRQADKIVRRASLVEVSALDIIINLQPFEEALLHVPGTKSEAVADIIKEQASPFRKEPAHQKGLERNVADARIFLDWEKVKNISVEDEKRIRAAVPAAGQFKCPATEGKTQGFGSRRT